MWVSIYWGCITVSLVYTALKYCGWVTYVDVLFSLIVCCLHWTYNYDFFRKCFDVICQCSCTKSLTAAILWSPPLKAYLQDLIWDFLMHAGCIYIQDCSVGGYLPHTVVYMGALPNYNNKQHCMNYRPDTFLFVLLFWHIDLNIVH